VIARIKVMAKLDIANRRISQDGRFEVTISNKDIGVRVSTMPTIYGENVVLRLLDKMVGVHALDRLQLDPRSQKLLQAMITKPYGMVVATGPTGSGKTTTLYALLAEVSTVEKNVITIEDPVEYRLPLVRQCQVNPKAGVTFAGGLRSIVRQDPDIIMVGEIRDVETAMVAVQAAMTGHLVFSTFHANDTPGALSRLIDMEIEPFLLGSAVVGVLAQRLVRALCPSCRTAYTPTSAQCAEIGLAEEPAKYVLFRGTGCHECRETGYKGRVPIFEIMSVSESIRELVVSRASADEIRRQAKKEGMRDLREYGLRKAIQGVTSVEEVLVWTQEV
jgi:type IV pilus assembly protein PilB